MTPTELGARIAIPLLLGALIGFERQWHRRLAGASYRSEAAKQRNGGRGDAGGEASAKEAKT